MKKNKIRHILLIQVLLLSTLTFVINTAPIILISTQNNNQGTSTTIEGEIPHTSGYKIEWEDNGVLICDEGGPGVPQKEIEICSDGDGGAIIVWMDMRAGGSNQQIYAQRIASNGTIMWDDGGIAICNIEFGGGYQQWAPAICSDGRGGAYIAWHGDRIGSNGFDIYVQRVDSDGNTQFTPNGTVICGAIGNQKFPDLCRDKDNNAIIAWQDERSGDLDVYIQVVSYYEDIKFLNGLAICNATGDQEAIKVCGDQNKHASIAWIDSRHAGYSLYAQLIEIDGFGTFEIEWNANGTSVCNSTMTNPGYDGPYLDIDNIAICEDRDDGAFIVWVDNRTESYSDYDIYAQRIAENGTVMWIANGSAINNELDTQHRVQICRDENAGAIITWMDGWGSIYGQRVNEIGTPLWTINGTEICDQEGDIWGQQICSDGEGGAFLSWSGEVEGTIITDIFVQKLTSDGSLEWTKSGINIVDADYDQKGLRMCYDGNGGIILAWKDERTDPDGDVYAQKVINVPSAPTAGGGGGGDGGGAGAEDNIIPLVILGAIVGLASIVMVVSYSVRKKKKARELLPFQKALEVSRGFEVAGDTFRFFVRIENTLDLAITNVSVKIIPPHTLKLDKKSPSREFLIGDVRSGKFGTAIFYLFCIACADTEINAEIDYKDPEGSLQIEKMHPFPIMSCKFVKPRKISMEEFEEEYQAKEKKTIEIRLRADISDEEAMKMLRDRLTMSTVASSSNSLAMSGRARDGSDILLKSVIKEIEGVKTAVASVVSSNQYVTMGVLSDIMETFSEFRQEAISKFEVLEKGHEEIKETVIREARKILENQIAEYELLEARNLELQEGIQKLSGKVEELELTGDFSQANEIKQQIESLNLEFRRTSQQLEAKMDEAIENVDKIFAELGKLEDIELYLKKHLDTDWERLQTSWAELKEGTINRKQFIAKGLGVVGKRFLKVAFNLAGMFI